jgi:hypothetical protein
VEPDIQLLLNLGCSGCRTGYPATVDPELQWL